MSVMSRAVILVSIILLSACAHQPTSPKGNEGVFVLLGSERVRVPLPTQPADNLDLVTMQNGSSELWTSSFTAPADAAARSRMQERRVKLFLANFVDDTEPYTGHVTASSKCLISNTSDVVAFMSGPEKRWSDCHLGGHRKALRVWRFCGDRLFEITVKTDLAPTDVSVECKP